MNYFILKSMSNGNLKFMETIFEVWIKIYNYFVRNYMYISQKFQLMIKMTPWHMYNLHTLRHMSLSSTHA
jgi:hypothetical protein